MARTIYRNEIAFRLTVPLTIPPKDLDRAITQEEIHISQVPDLDLSWGQKMAILVYCCGADDKTLRLHACGWCRHTLLGVEPLGDSLAWAVWVAERYHKGGATLKDLKDAARSLDHLRKGLNSLARSKENSDLIPLCYALKAACLACSQEDPAKMALAALTAVRDLDIVLRSFRNPSSPQGQAQLMAERAFQRSVMDDLMVRILAQCPK